MNLYRDSAPPWTVPPSLDGDARADVVVVGAGITGLSTALHLAEKGTAVVVLDSHEPGYGASGRNGGQVNAGLKHDPDVVERDFGGDLGSRMNALAAGAPTRVFELIERHRIHCEARRNGTLRAALSAPHVARVRVSAEQLRRRGAPVDVVEGAALRGLTGTDRYPAAMLDRRGGDLNPLRYVRGLAHAASQKGAVVHGNTRVTAIEADGGRWAVMTGTGTVRAEHVVFATNGYTDGIWPDLQRSIVPLFGAIAATEPLPAEVAASVMPSRAVLYESGAITVYYRVDADGRLVMGGRGPMREILSSAAIPHLTRYASSLWPSLRDARWTHGWGGRLAMTKDQYPHIHEPARGILACLGYNGRGVALATAMGEQLAGRLSGTGTFDMPITDIRTIAFHSLWPMGVRAAIARGRLMDFLGR